MIKVAFASNDEIRVNLHFGAAESFVVYAVSPGAAELVGVGRFVAVEMKGVHKDKGLPRDRQGVASVVVPAVEDYPPLPADKPPEDKVVAKLEFLKDCAAVYAASIGSSSIKRLMMAGIQPVIVDNGHEILDLLNEVSLALCMEGGLSWVDRAKARGRAGDAPDMAGKDGWLGEAAARDAGRRALITAVDALE